MVAGLGNNFDRLSSIIIPGSRVNIGGADENTTKTVNINTPSNRISLTDSITKTDFFHYSKLNQQKIYNNLKLKADAYVNHLDLNDMSKRQKRRYDVCKTIEEITITNTTSMTININGTTTATSLVTNNIATI